MEYNYYLTASTNYQHRVQLEWIGRVLLYSKLIFLEDSNLIIDVQKCYVRL
jgi:hypothetical protein